MKTEEHEAVLFPLIMYLFGFWVGWVFVAASGLSLVVAGGRLLCRGSTGPGHTSARLR